MASPAEVVRIRAAICQPPRAGAAPITAGNPGYPVVQPDRTTVKTMALLMEAGFGADVDLVAKGDYKITAVCPSPSSRLPSARGKL